MENRIQVFIVDDHPIFRFGLRQIIELDPRFQVAGEAADGLLALDEIKRRRPQIAVIDLDLPRLNGLDLTRELQKLRPPVPAIILTMHNDENMFNAAMDGGARGFILKENAANDLINGLKAVNANEVFLTPSISGYLLRRSQRAAQLRCEVPALAHLTPTERKVLKLIGENLTSKEIGRRLFVSPRTIDTHRNNIAGKLGLHGSHRLLEFALKHQSDL